MGIWVKFFGSKTSWAHRIIPGVSIPFIAKKTFGNCNLKVHLNFIEARPGWRKCLGIRTSMRLRCFGLRTLGGVTFLYRASQTAMTMLLAPGLWASMLCWRNEFFYWSKFFNTKHGQSSTFGSSALKFYLSISLWSVCCHP